MSNSDNLGKYLSGYDHLPECLRPLRDPSSYVPLSFKEIDEALEEGRKETDLAYRLRPSINLSSIPFFSR